MIENASRIDPKTNRIEYLDTRWYKIEGIEKPMPSVTMVIGDVLAKGEGFDNFLMTSGFNAEIVVKRAGESGTRLHKAFESAILGNEVRADNIFLGESGFSEKEWQKIQDFQNWYENLNPVPLYLEKTVFSQEWDVAGTADWIGFIGGELWLLDWKTGNNVYDSADYQVAAYKKMYNEIADKLGMPLITKAGIVHVGASNKTEREMNNRGVKVTEVTKADEQTFWHINEIWKQRNPDPKIPTHNYPVSVKFTKGILNFKEEELVNGKQ